MNLISREEERKYFAEAATFDESELEKAESLVRKLWYALFGSGVVIALVIVLVIVVLSMRDVFPFLITQHKDGTMEVTDLIANPQKTYDDALNEYWVRLYVANRENWNYSQAQALFDTTQLLNTPAQQNAYRNESQPQNAESKSKKYGQNWDVMVRENSPPVRVDYKKETGVHIMTYRWSRVVTSRVDNRPPLTVNLVSTVTFRYDGVPATAAVRKVNPLGFQVVDYRSDIDQGGALK